MTPHQTTNIHHPGDPKPEPRPTPTHTADPARAKCPIHLPRNPTCTPIANFRANCPIVEGHRKRAVPASIRCSSRRDLVADRCKMSTQRTQLVPGRNTPTASDQAWTTPRAPCRLGGSGRIPHEGGPTVRQWTRRPVWNPRRHAHPRLLVAPTHMRSRAGPLSWVFVLTYVLAEINAHSRSNVDGRANNVPAIHKRVGQ